MSGPFKRRSSLKTLPPIETLKSHSLRRQSSLGLKSVPASEKDLRWDVLERCALPVIFCHAAAAILSTVLNILRISEVSTFTLFIWFTIATIGVILCYHSLKVTTAGKAVLITGCDSRIGSSLARQLDEQGFTVFAGFQNLSENALAEELKEECSGRLHVLQLDVSSETQILAASLYAVEHLPDGAPGLWAIIHTASWVALGEIEWIPPQVIKKATDVNLLGPTRVTQILLPLVRRGHGRVIYMSSGLCRVATPVRGIHCSLLAALEYQTECLRKELRPRGVDVVVVAPGEYASKNSWLSDETIVDQARDMWAQLCQEQKTEYGQEYFETALRSLEKYTKTQDADLSSVLNALNDAVIRTFPMPRYTPVTPKEKLQAFVADYFPRSVYDIIYA